MELKSPKETYVCFTGAGLPSFIVEIPESDACGLQVLTPLDIAKISCKMQQLVVDHKQTNQEQVVRDS